MYGLLSEFLGKNAQKRLYRAINWRSVTRPAREPNHSRLAPEVKTKRAVDMVGAATGLAVLAPLFLLIAAALKWWDPGPLFFAHVRIGRGGRPFRCLKFRTMSTNSDTILAHHLRENPDARREWLENRKLKDDPRVTVVGEFLRKTSLDELPQLINVLRGEMSLVGPRPIVEAELELYGRAREEYLAVRPGITGLWQVSGRSDTSYDERVRLDSEYVRTCCFWRDCAIICRTVYVTLFQKGSY